MANTVYPGPAGSADPAVVQRALVRDYIDNTLAELLQALALPPEEGKPSVTLRLRSKETKYTINPQSGALEARQPVVSTRTYSWPGNSHFEAWRFCMSVWSWNSLLFGCFPGLQCCHWLMFGETSGGPQDTLHH